jgi:hypothetical protein
MDRGKRALEWPWMAAEIKRLVDKRGEAFIFFTE